LSKDAWERRARISLLLGYESSFGSCRDKESKINPPTSYHSHRKGPNDTRIKLRTDLPALVHSLGIVTVAIKRCHRKMRVAIVDPDSGPVPAQLEENSCDLRIKNCIRKICEPNKYK